MKNLNQTILFVVVLVIITLVLSVIYAVPIMLLWNWLLPSLFGAPLINVLQAWGLGLLISLLFGRVTLKSENK